MTDQQRQALQDFVLLDQAYRAMGRIIEGTPSAFEVHGRIVHTARVLARDTDAALLRVMDELGT